MSKLDKQIEAIKEIYREVKKVEGNVPPIIVGKFALTVYTQGMYPSDVISLLHPDIPFMKRILFELGYREFGDFFMKGDITVEISKKFEFIRGRFNQIEVEGEIINVLSLEDLLIDMMNECIEGDDIVCDLVKMLIRSYRQFIDFHYIFMNVKDKRAVIKFKQFRGER